MRLIPVLLLSLPIYAIDSIHYFELPVTFKDNAGISVTATPLPFVSDAILDADTHHLNRRNTALLYDAPIRQTAYLLRTLERNRGTVLGGSDKAILSYKFELAVRDLKGEPLSLKEYKVTVGMSSEANTGYISVDDGAKKTFAINELTGTEEYRQFLKMLVMPFEHSDFSVPGMDAFLVDLYFKWPEVEVDKDDFSVFDLFPSAILWDRGIITKVKINLGTTYCYKENGIWEQANSKHISTHKRALEDYSNILKLLADENPDEIIPALEDYIRLAPGDQKAREKLMDWYLEEELMTEAYDLISRFQPFFATIRGGIANLRALERQAIKKRNLLLGKRSQFKRDENIKLEILSPVDNDLVSGTTDLQFTLEGESPLLQVNCFLDEQLIASLEEPPFKVPFSVDGLQGRMRIRVAAYFENQTYMEKTVTIKTLRVDNEEEVNLVPLRAVVTQGRSRFLGQLTKDDFEINENGEGMKVETFRKDTAPLRVAILVDTSISMFGPKLYRAQYAINRFLSAMQEQDRVSIYSFDDKVLKLSDFTNDYTKVRPQLFTLSPKLSTSLYDAMLIAHDALLGQNGIKVMIVLSDGDDSSSVTTDAHIVQMLNGSPVMIYSIILPGGVFRDYDAAGLNFMREMARLTGSVSLRVNKTKDIDEDFDQIIEELRSFYYLEYYSKLPKQAERKLKVKVNKAGAKVRPRVL